VFLVHKALRDLRATPVLPDRQDPRANLVCLVHQELRVLRANLAWRVLPVLREWPAFKGLLAQVVSVVLKARLDPLARPVPPLLPVPPG
jgi:hypothetical protein